MYGELLDQASTHLATATLAFAQYALTSEAVHGTRLSHTAGCSRRSAPTSSTCSAATPSGSPAFAAAPTPTPVTSPPSRYWMRRTNPCRPNAPLALILAPSRRSHGPQQRALGATSDLLATQRDSHGRWRSPQGWLLDEPDVRAAGLREVASVALVVAGAADQLRLYSEGLERRWFELRCCSGYGAAAGRRDHDPLPG
jgi:hypothetical protein